MYNSQTVVDRIKELVKGQGHTMTDINTYCDIDKSTINMSSQKKYGLSAKILYDAADFLNCSVDYLLGRTDTPQLPISDLTDDEAELIELYRKLSPREQGDIFGRVDTLAAIREKSFKQEKA